MWLNKQTVRRSGGAGLAGRGVGYQGYRLHSEADPFRQHTNFAHQNLREEVKERQTEGERVGEREVGET